MASKDDEKKKGLPTGAIVAIVLIVIALLGALGWYMYTKKGANAALPNVGTPAPGGNAAVTSMPSPSNVSAGNGNGAGTNTGRVGAQV
jgi:uncharacterized membrane protein AbrB (regulator of aidB expression)